jgi:hypothetical protein
MLPPLNLKSLDTIRILHHYTQHTMCTPHEKTTAKLRDRAFELASGLSPELQLKLQAVEKRIRDEIRVELERGHIYTCLKIMMSLTEDTTTKLFEDLRVKRAKEEAERTETEEPMATKEDEKESEETDEPKLTLEAPPVVLSTPRAIHSAHTLLPPPPPPHMP